MNHSTWRGYWWLPPLFILLYLFTRWYSLTLLPIHYDEILYLDRAERVAERGDYLWALRGGGLKAAHLWLTALMWPLSEDRLWLGRFASTMVGLWGGLAVYKAGRVIFAHQAVGILTAMLYLLSPVVLFYHRMTLAESLLMACAAWIFYGVAALFLQRAKWPLLWLGPVAAIAALTKPSGVIFFAIPVLGALLLQPRAPGSKFSLKWVGLAALPFLAGGLLALALILPALDDVLPDYLSHHAGVDTVQTVDLGTRYLNNMRRSADWLLTLFTMPLSGLAIAGLFIAMLRKQQRRTAIWLLLTLLIYWSFFALASDIWYPRYLLPLTVPTLLLAGYALHQLWLILPRRGGYHRVMAAMLTLMLLLPALRVDFWLWIDPARAPLHPEERRQYITDWPSAYGLQEVARFIQQLAMEHATMYVVYNERIMARYGLPYYLPHPPPPNIEFVSVDPGSGVALLQMDDLAKERPTYFLLNTAREKGMEHFIEHPEKYPQAEHVFAAYRPGALTWWDIYRWR